MVSFGSHISLTRNYFFRSCPKIFPEIDKVIVLSQLPSGEIDGLEIVRENYQYKEKVILTEEITEQFASEKERAIFLWLNKEQLPFEFEENSRNIGQLNLFSEQKHFILQIKITTKVADGEVIDVFYLFFRENQSNFGVSRIDGIFDTSRKALLGTMLSKYIPIFYDYANTEREKFYEFTKETKELLNQTNRLNDRTLLLDMMRQWADDFLNDYQRPSGINFRLSKQALEILAEHDFKTAREMLGRAAAYSLLLHSDSNQAEIEIQHNYLYHKHIESETKKPKIQVELSAKSKKLKVMKMLDNLEIAATKLLEIGEDLTGKNVGKALQNPISAPAITDYLHKNSRHVGILLEEHTDKWEIIRSNFRPLVNVREKFKSKRNAG